MTLGFNVSKWKNEKKCEEDKGMKIDWKAKLTSRKLWVSIAGFVTMLLTASGMDPDSSQQIAAIIMAGAIVISYIIGEGLVDASNIPPPPPPAV